MHLGHTFDHLGIPRIRHHKGHKNAVVILEPARQHHHDPTRAGQQRYRSASYSDPWPDRA